MSRKATKNEDAAPSEDEMNSNQVKYGYTQVKTFKADNRARLGRVKDNDVLRVRIGSVSKDGRATITYEAANVSQNVFMTKVFPTADEAKHEVRFGPQQAALNRPLPPQQAPLNLPLPSQQAPLNLPLLPLQNLQLPPFPVHQLPQSLQLPLQAQLGRAAPVPVPTRRSITAPFPEDYANVLASEGAANEDTETSFDSLNDETQQFLWDLAAQPEPEELPFTQAGQWSRPTWYPDPPQLEPNETAPEVNVNQSQYFAMFENSESFCKLPINDTEGLRNIPLYIHKFLPPRLLHRFLQNLNAVINPPITICTLYRFFGAYLYICRTHFVNRQEAFAAILNGFRLSDYISLSDYQRIFANLRIVDFITRTREEKEKELDILWGYFNTHMRDVFRPGNHLHADESMLGWFGRSGSWKDVRPNRPPHVFSMQNKPTSRGFLFKNIACVKSKVIFVVELQHGSQTMQARKAEQPGGGPMRATTATLLRLLYEANLSPQAGPRLLVGDSWYSSVETAQALLRYNIYFVGHVRQQFRGFPKDLLDLMHGSYARLESKTDYGTVYASRKKVREQSNIYMVSTCNGASSELPDVAEGRMYRGNNHAVDNNNQVRAYINTETTALIRDYRIKHIMGLLGLCVTNAFEFYRYEAMKESSSRNHLVSHEFVKVVAEHLLTNNFGVPPVENDVPRPHKYTTVEKWSKSREEKKKTKSGRCVICKKRGASWHCLTCSVEGHPVRVCCPGKNREHDECIRKHEENKEN